MRFEVLTAVKI